jgi:hypothetical protein
MGFDPSWTDTRQRRQVLSDYIENVSICSDRHPWIELGLISISRPAKIIATSGIIATGSETRRLDRSSCYRDYHIWKAGMAKEIDGVLSSIFIPNRSIW